MREVAQRSSGAVTLHPGTLYRALARLLESGLIDELDERPDAANDDERRRYYRLSDRGIAVARAEAERMASQLAAARSRKLLRHRA
jgi:DNA-binding PadR family transcriptional regulator